MSTQRLCPLTEELCGEIVADSVWDAEGNLLLNPGDRLTRIDLETLFMHGIDAVPLTVPENSGPSNAAPNVKKDRHVRCTGCDTTLSITRPRARSDIKAWSCAGCGEVYVGELAEGPRDASEALVHPINLLLNVVDDGYELPKGSDLHPERPQVRYKGADRREFSRLGLAMPIAVAPLDEDFRLAGEPLQLETRNMSLEGAAIPYPQPTPHPHVLVELSSSAIPRVLMLGEIRRTSPAESGVELGVLWLGRVRIHGDSQTPTADTAASLAVALSGH